MFKQKNYVALCAVVFVAVLLLSLPTRATARLKLAVGSWFLPLFGLADAGQQLLPDLADNTLPRRELLREIDNLRKENQQLREQQIQSMAIARENDQLRHPAWLATPCSLAPQTGQRRYARPGQLVAYHPIDLGSRDGVTHQPARTHLRGPGWPCLGRQLCQRPSGNLLATPIAASPPWWTTSRMTWA